MQDKGITKVNGFPIKKFQSQVYWIEHYHNKTLLFLLHNLFKKIDQ